jgi:hypothetical protein
MCVAIVDDGAAKISVVESVAREAKKDSPVFVKPAERVGVSG